MVNDSTAESSETAIVTLSTLSNISSITTASQTHTITDTDANPTVALSVNSSTSAENDTTTVTYTATLSAASGKVCTVNYAVSGTASLTSDYTNASGDYSIASNGTISFAAGETSKTIKLTVVNDSTAESSETAIVTLSTLSNISSITTASQTHTITDTDANPTVALSVSSATSAENDTTIVTYTATLSSASGKVCTVNYAVSGTASFTSDYTNTSGDYSIASNGTISFAAGETSKTIKLTVVNDSTAESSETAIVTLSTLSNISSITTASQTHTITDTDSNPTVALSVSSSTSAENDTTTVTYTATLSAASGKVCTVNYAVSGTASLTSDYTNASGDYSVASNGTISFAAGETSKTIKLTVVNDSTAESSETAIVTLSTLSNISSITTASQTHTITDTDANPTVALSVSSSTSAENDTTTVTYTATLSAASGKVCTVNYAVSGTASLTSDYTNASGDYSIASNGTISFAVGETSKTIKLTVVNDSTAESSETAIVTLSTLSNISSITTASQSLFIAEADADTKAAKTVSSSTSAENDTTTVTYTATLSAASGKVCTVNYVVSGTTSLTSDYTNASGDYSIVSNSTISFAAGETSKTIKLTVVNDGSAEPSETAIVTLSTLSNISSITTASQTHTITDSDANPTVALSASSSTSAENDAITVIYTATLSAASSKVCTVNYAVSGTASLGSDYTNASGDYSIASSGVISFAAGETTKTIKLTVVNDGTAESSETAIVTLSILSNISSITTASQTHTITDVDADPTVALSMSSSISAEDDTKTVTYTATLSTVSSKICTVNYGISGTASLTSDYTNASGDYSIASNGTISFAAGETSKTIKLIVVNDGIAEPSETVTVTLSTLSNISSITMASHTHTITDVDADPTVALSMSSATSAENDTTTVTYTATLSTVSSKICTVNYGISGTASLTSDYINASGDYSIASNGTISFAAGETSKTIKLIVVNDGIAEPSETVTVTLSTLSNISSITTASQTHTITDVDANPTVALSMSSATSAENDTTTVTYTATLSAASGKVCTVNYAVSGTTSLTSDYTNASGDYSIASNGTVSFAAGETAKTISFVVVDDNVPEDTETVVITFSSVNNITSITTASSLSHSIIDADNVAPIITEGESISVVMDEDGVPTAFNLVLHVSDADGDSIQWQILSAPSKGSAEVSGVGLTKSIAYTPTANWNGADSFVVEVTDGIETDTITVMVTVAPRNDASVNTIVPTVSGLLYDGQELVATTGTWSDVIDVAVSGSSLISYTYQWQRADNQSGANTTTITGATNATYLLASEDIGFSVRVVVTAIDTGVGLPSTSTAVMASDWSVAVINNTAPVITEGDAFTFVTDEDVFAQASIHASDVDNDVLTWSIESPAQNGLATAAGTGTEKIIGYTPNIDWNGTDTFVLRVSDGKEFDDITVTVTVSPRNDAPVNTVAPSIVGTMREWQTLTAVVGEWNDEKDTLVSGSSSLTYSFQWQRADDASGTNASDLSGATLVSYQLQTEDVQKFIRVVVTASDNGVGLNAVASAAIESTWYGIVVENGPPTIIDQSLSVMENVAIGTELGLITAQNSESDGLHFSIDAEVPFAIDVNGKLTTTDMIDYESKSLWVLTVSVADDFGMTASGLVTVVVTDADEAIDITEIVITGKVIGSLPQTVTVDGVPVVMNNNQYQWVVPTGADGTTTLTVRVSDTEGQVTKTVDITETTIPTGGVQ